MSTLSGPLSQPAQAEAELVTAGPVSTGAVTAGPVTEANACACDLQDAQPRSVVQLQGSYIQQGSETTLQGRASLLQPVHHQGEVGASVEFTQGDNLTGTSSGVQLQELYYRTALPSNPNVNLTLGQTDLTSHFDRNSFSKDGTTHFFHPTLQSNPALVGAGLSRRPAALVRWRMADGVMAKAGVFSSDESLTELSANGAAAEVGIWQGNTLVRATYLTGEDRGADTGFREIYGLPRGGGQTGLQSSDREHALGLNAETFVPGANLGLFARYGWYHNAGIGESAQSYSVGLNALDVMRDRDRLGLAYGRDLSNDRLRKQQGAPVPDVLEVFYDAPVTPYLRAGVTLQQRDAFSETVAGFRVKANFVASPIANLFQ